MARARKPQSAAKLPVVTLPPAASPAATAGPDLPAAAAPGVERGIGLSLNALTEYEPPPLPPGPAAPGTGRAGGPVAFRVAAASAALPPVPIVYDSAARVWLLQGDYSYVYQGYTLTARDGYAFDLASVPRPLWWLIAPNELSIVAPLFHDLIYEFKGRLPVDQVTPYRTYTRREADDLFYHLMEVEGIAWWRRNAAYSAVRAAGGVYWAT